MRLLSERNIAAVIGMAAMGTGAWLIAEGQQGLVMGGWFLLVGGALAMALRCTGVWR